MVTRGSREKQRWPEGRKDLQIRNELGRKGCEDGNTMGMPGTAIRGRGLETFSLGWGEKQRALLGKRKSSSKTKKVWSITSPGSSREALKKKSIYESVW